MTEPSADASSPGPGDEARAAFDARCNAVEEAYEFMLAYAAQGLASDGGSESRSQIREFLGRCDAALGEVGEATEKCVQCLDVESAEPYRAFIEVLDRDARHAQAAVRLVLAQPSIGSQLVDNLNASIHLRALLTDLFLVDEVLKSHDARSRRYASP